jgi:hypothetical protein
MDPTTFDTLVQRLSTAPSRRRLLKVLASGGLGALATALGRAPARAREGRTASAAGCRGGPPSA